MWSGLGCPAGSKDGTVTGTWGRLEPQRCPSWALEAGGQAEGPAISTSRPGSQQNTTVTPGDQGSEPATGTHRSQLSPCGVTLSLSRPTLRVASAQPETSDGPLPAGTPTTWAWPSSACSWGPYRSELWRGARRMALTPHRLVPGPGAWAQTLHFVLESPQR